ncbi:MAG: sulfatase-like hydrolase/transferase [Planctomycetaceae bacterium]
MSTPVFDCSESMRISDSLKFHPVELLECGAVDLFNSFMGDTMAASWQRLMGNALGVGGFLLVCLAGMAVGAERVNVLFVISDDQSYPHASAYGCRGIETPGFDRVAKEGVLFTNAYAASPGCSPCRAALLTGRHCWQIEQAGTHASSFPLVYRSFPELLAERGYFTGFTGKGWGPGNHKVDGRTENPAGPSFSKKQQKPPHSGMSNNDYSANFAEFLKQRPAEQPFCFWYGASEPHRSFEKGAGLKEGKKLEDVDVPPFLPDTPEVRSDILDYYVEIEWFDRHLQQMLQQLAEAGELDRTLIIVTSDNGMAFPRAKANGYDAGIHLPLAIRWGDRVPGGRTVDDLVGFVDLTATILDACGVDLTTEEFQQPARKLAGRSLVDLLEKSESGRLDESRNAVFSSRERHSSSRYWNQAYPVRAMRTPDYLCLHNLRPERAPAGPPVRFAGGVPEGALTDLYSGFPDIDACPTLTHLIDLKDDPQFGRFLNLATDHRPEFEIFDINKDPHCLTNLADRPEFQETATTLKERLRQHQQATGDPRYVHPDRGDVFETYRRYSPIRYFPEPDWARQQREQREADGWVRLFDGVSLKGWKVAGNPKSFDVVNGNIQATALVDHSKPNNTKANDSRGGGPQPDAKGQGDKPVDMAHLYYVGPDGEPGTEDDDFTNFELSFEALTTPGSNGGVYFHTSWQPTGFPNDGHEVQVNQSHSNKTRTGSLFGVVNVAETTALDNNFVQQLVTVRGRQVTISVNGKQTVNYTEPADFQHPVYTGRNIDHGTFCLQAHDPQSTTFYRQIWVRKLPGNTVDTK